MDIFDVMWLIANLFGAGLSGVYIYVAHLERAKTHGTSLNFSWASLIARSRQLGVRHCDQGVAPPCRSFR
jgi:hypothetical protein